MTRRAYIDASNAAVMVQLAVDLHGGTRQDFMARPPDYQERLLRRANRVLRKLRKITLDHERDLAAAVRPEGAGQ